MTAHAFPTGTILGYPRIGRRRELKRAVEAFWAGTIDAAELEARAAELRAATRERLASLGLGRDDSSIPESFSFYDQVLDAAVAAFPTGHPRSHGVNQDVDALLAKEVAGANLAITQLFWHADDYLGFVERARAAGVTIPIVPGIMPVTTPARLARVTELTRVEPPSELVIDLEIEPDPESCAELGIAYTARLAHEVLDGDAPGLHLYTFNRHDAVLDVLGRLDLHTTPQLVDERNTTPR